MSPYFGCISSNFISVDDDNALRAKVDEALSVYDEYMKTKDPGDANGARNEDGARADGANGLTT